MKLLLFSYLTVSGKQVGTFQRSAAALCRGSEMPMEWYGEGRPHSSQRSHPLSLQGYSHQQGFLPNCLLWLVRSEHRVCVWYCWQNAAAQPQVLGYSHPSTPWASLTHGGVPLCSAWGRQQICHSLKVTEIHRVVESFRLEKASVNIYSTLQPSTDKSTTKPH